jgi:hypothetical protein
MYFAANESMLETTVVKEGRPSAPGAGCIQSAPVIPIIFSMGIQVDGQLLTHDDGGIGWVMNRGAVEDSINSV